VREEEGRKLGGEERGGNKEGMEGGERNGLKRVIHDK